MRIGANGDVIETVQGMAQGRLLEPNISDIDGLPYRLAGIGRRLKRLADIVAWLAMDNFFVMVGGGSAALAGLIFVAMSFNPEAIIRNSTHRNRAINMLSGFSAIFVACGLALIEDQPLQVLGFEWLGLWLIATFIFIRGYVVAIRAGMSSIGLTAPRLGGGTLCYLAEVAGSLLLIFGNSAGFHVAAIATMVLFAFLISGAWLLIVGAYEGQTPR